MHRVEVKCKRYVKPEVFYANSVDLGTERVTITMLGLGVVYYPVEEVEFPVKVTPCAYRALTISLGSGHGTFVPGVRSMQ